MGIDIYMHWAGMTPVDKKAQLTEWTGSVGYLRESYHGDPYATRVLAPESFRTDFESCTCPSLPLESGTTAGDLLDALADQVSELCSIHSGVPIEARVLVERLPETLLASKERAQKLYGLMGKELGVHLQQFIDFVELAVRKESETGEPVRIYASW